MDYKELYEAIFKYAKQLYDAGSYDNETLEAIFPELKESEDEKIRKELIFYLRYQHSISENFDDIGKWIAWLEKQGDWKPSEVQMSSIKQAVENMKQSACYDSELVSLYYDLKKLREE
jgi:hypothetical protein